jgi:hypothetical protein
MVRRTTMRLLIAALLLAWTRPTVADEAGEYAVKAAFLYNFGKFVQWPADAFRDAEEPLVLGLLGEDPFDGLLEQIAGERQIQGRKIVIRRWHSPREVGRCHILFVSRSQEQNLSQLMRVLGEAPVLTVSDIHDFAERGGAISLYLEERRVRFSVNLETAQRAGLKVSSQLLKIARVVH